MRTSPVGSRRPRCEPRAALLGAVVLLSAACGGTNIVGDASGSPTPATSSSPAAELPPRPRYVLLDGLDPCRALTPQQLTELGVNREPRQFEGGNRGEAQCEFEHIYTEPYYRYIVGMVLTEGAEAWLTEQRTVEVRTLSVAGFGAVETRTLGEDDLDCMLSIDVADGQSLDVSFVSSDDQFTTDDLCDRALVGAEAVMATLLAG